MRNANVTAANLKMGDVINGKRINHAPIVHPTKRGTTVHFFVSNHGRMEPVSLLATATVNVKRPIYNLTRKPKPKVRAKDGTPVAQETTTLESNVKLLGELLGLVAV